MNARSRPLFIEEIPSIVSHEKRGILADYAKLLATGTTQLVPDPDIKKSLALYGDPLMDSLLVDVQPIVEGRLKEPLLPTYSYLRMYLNGSSLPRHIDRSSCEVTVSVCLAFDASEEWPLCVEVGNVTHCFHLAPGNALLYFGCQSPHWRSRFTGTSCTQVFLHYVFKKGDNTEWMYDKRASLSSIKHGLIPPAISRGER